MNEIEKIKHEVKMNEWSRQVMSWRESGLSATAWCKRENIPCSTFSIAREKFENSLSTISEKMNAASNNCRCYRFRKQEM